jgi:hypothetical protein
MGDYSGAICPGKKMSRRNPMAAHSTRNHGQCCSAAEK